MSQFNKVFEQLKNKIEIGLIEKLTLFFVGKNNPVLIDIPSKVDSGNDAMMVLHAVTVDEDNDYVTFQTINNKVLKMRKHGDVVIHIGSGNKELRPIVKFDVKLGDTIYKDISFSLADRTENEYPILISKEFVSHIDALIDVDKNGLMSDE